MPTIKLIGRLMPILACMGSFTLREGVQAPTCGKFVYQSVDQLDCWHLCIGCTRNDTDLHESTDEGCNALEISKDLYGLLAEPQDGRTYLGEMDKKSNN